MWSVLIISRFSLHDHLYNFVFSYVCEEGSSTTILRLQLKKELRDAKTKVSPACNRDQIICLTWNNVYVNKHVARAQNLKNNPVFALQEHSKSKALLGVK